MLHFVRRTGFETNPVSTRRDPVSQYAGRSEAGYDRDFGFRAPAADFAIDFHAAEVGYVFGTNVPPSGPHQARERAMSEMISSYWARFATTGNPNGDGAPVWNPYRFEDR